MEEVNEAYAIFFLAYKCLVGLSVFKVITGVFLHETFKVCSEDDELVIIQKKRTLRKNTIKVEKIFKEVDKSGDGVLEWEEFEKIAKDPWLVDWLSAMDLDAKNAARLWKLMRNADGRLTAEDLVKGVSRLRGQAKSIDMNQVVMELDEFRASLEAVCRNQAREGPKNRLMEIPRLMEIDSIIERAHITQPKTLTGLATRGLAIGVQRI